MRPEKDIRTLSFSKDGKQLEKLTSVDNDFDNFSERDLHPRSIGRTIQPSVDIDEFDEPTKKGLNLRPLWRIMRRNVLLITGVTTVVTATALYSGLLSQPPRTYEGDFRLLVEPITSEAKLTDPSVLSRDERVSPNDSQVDYPTLLQVLQSPGLLSKITKQIQTRYPDVSYDSLSKDLVVQRIGTNLSDTTKLIEVSYKGEDPKKVQFVLTELAKGYLKYSLEDRKTRIGLGVLFIENQLPRLQQRVDNLEGQLQALQQQHKLSDPTSEGAELAKQLRDIQAQRQEARRQLLEQKTLYKNLQRELQLAPSQALAASALSENPNYQELLTQLKKTESEIAVQSARFSKDNPVIQSLQDKQTNLSLLLKQEAQRIVGQDLANKTVSPQILTFQNSTRQELIKQLIDTANQGQVLEVRNQAVGQAETSIAQQVKQLPAIIRQYNTIQRQLDVATKTLNQLLVQRETLRVEAAQKEVPWQIVSQPSIPRDAAGNPISDPQDTTKTLAMVVIAGFVLGLGAAILREKYRKVFSTTEDLQEAVLELPLLEVSAANESAKQFSNNSSIAGAIAGTEAKRADDSSFLQTFSSLYASIRFLASAPSVRSMVICSAEPGAGKTTIALHLAKAAAVMGQRVLLVDANFRLPQLHDRLGLPNLQGLSNLLSENLAPIDLIQRSPLEENLFVLTSGQVPSDPIRLLASARMRNLVKQFQTDFDLVIYDTPHLHGLEDANFLAAHTDGILMVVRVGKTNRSLLMQVLNKLKSFHLPILGIVANPVGESKNSSRGTDNRHYNQNHRRHPTLGEKSQTGKTNLLTSGKQVDDACR